MDKDRGMSISYLKLFMVECYVWLMAGCVIEESQGLASMNGFALMNGMGCPSRIPKRTHLEVYETRSEDQGRTSIDPWVESRT